MKAAIYRSGILGVEGHGEMIIPKKLCIGGRDRCKVFWCRMNLGGEKMDIGDLKKYGYSQRDYDDMKATLSEKFGQEASHNDIIWSLLGSYSEIMMKTGDYSKMKELAWDKAVFIASEGKDPTYIIDNYETSLVQFGFGFIKTFSQDELKALRKIKREQGDQIPELMLLSADPTPAVLDELRKIYSARAWKAKRNNDWETVIYYLEHYNNLAEANKEFCRKFVNSPPPEHTEKDKKLLELARAESE